jgi:Ser/Thr protein kinase RdoA (MazF antagonist)
MIISDAITVGRPGGERGPGKEGIGLPRIGTVIRDVYRRPGADAVPAHLEDCYGIIVDKATRLAPGVYRVDRRDGPAWVARANLAARPAERARDDADVLRLLERRGIRAERCAHPEPVSELGGRAILVTEFVPGRPCPATGASARELGRLLGQIHSLDTEAGPSRRPAGSLHHLPAYEGGPGQDLAAASAMLADLDGRVPAEHRAVYESLLQLTARGDDCSGLPESFVHPDPVRVNAIATADGPVLVDWTGAGRGPRLASLAVLLQSAGPPNAPAVMRGYAEYQQLTAGELDRLEGALWIRPLWLAAWQCWLAVVSAKVNRSHVPDGRQIAALAASTRAACRDLLAGGGRDGQDGS